MVGFYPVCLGETVYQSQNDIPFKLSAIYAFDFIKLDYFIHSLEIQDATIIKSRWYKCFTNLLFFILYLLSILIFYFKRIDTSIVKVPLIMVKILNYHKIRNKLP